MYDLIALSPIAALEPVVVSGWQVSGRRAVGGLTLTDLTPLGKILVRAPAGGGMERELGVPPRRAARDRDGALVISSGPGEWMIFGPVGEQDALARRVTAAAAPAAETELVSVADLTHGRALMRLTGVAASQVLAKVCAIDLSDAVTPDGAAFRSSVARVVADVVRDDHGGPPSYLLHCERSSGQYLFDALLDAGAESGAEIEGFRPPGI